MSVHTGLLKPANELPAMMLQALQRKTAVLFTLLIPVLPALMHAENAQMKTEIP